VVVDHLDGAVRLDEVKVLGRGDGDGLEADEREELEREEADRGRGAVDQVLPSATTTGGGGGDFRLRLTHGSPSTLAGGHACPWLSKIACSAVTHATPNVDAWAMSRLSGTLKTMSLAARAYSANEPCVGPMLPWIVPATLSPTLMSLLARLGPRATTVPAMSPPTMAPTGEKPKPTCFQSVGFWRQRVRGSDGLARGCVGRGLPHRDHKKQGFVDRAAPARGDSTQDDRGGGRTGIRTCAAYSTLISTSLSSSFGVAISLTDPFLPCSVSLHVSYLRRVAGTIDHHA
jgi:hypothetical protein